MKCVHGPLLPGMFAVKWRITLTDQRVSPFDIRDGSQAQTPAIEVGFVMPGVWGVDAPKPGLIEFTFLNLPLDDGVPTSYLEQHTVELSITTADETNSIAKCTDTKYIGDGKFTCS